MGAKEDKAAEKEAKAAEKAAKKAAALEAKAAKAKPKKKTASANEYNFFLLHGEKIGIAVAVLVFLGLVATGSGLKKFTLTPEQINQSSTNADKTIKDSTLTASEYDETVKVFPYDSYAELIKSSIKVNSYETANRWEQSLFPDKVKRPNVVPLPLENLRAVACVGAIMYKELTAAGAQGGDGGAGAMGGGAMGGGAMGGGMGGANGSGDLKGRKWITLTGSLPIRKQQAAYNDLFSNAQYLDDVRDQPRYLFYELERAEVGPSGSATESDWKKIDVVRAIKKENQQWSGVGYDQVGDSYIAPIVSSFPPMAMNCPPMANKPFGEEVANLPNIPLNSTEQIEVQDSALKEWSELQENMNKFEEADLLERDPFADSGLGGGAGAMGGAAMGGAGRMGGGAQGDSGNSWLVNQNAVQEANIRVEQTSAVDYYLFRYFDFDVEADKTYVYRVKLLLANPNYGVQESFVEDPDAAQQRYITSEFSKPSNPVALGEVSRVYAESVESSSKPGADPSIVLSSVYFDEEDASESCAQGQKMKRGQMANFYGQTHTPIEVAGASNMMAMMDGNNKKKGGKGGKAKSKSVNHVSNECVVDAIGGDKITGVELRSPGKIMMLEPNGMLRVREVKEDARELKRYDGSGGMMGGLGTGAAGSMM